jgi:hypothetical protein
MRWIKAMEIRKYFCMEPARTHNSPESPNKESCAKRGNARAQEGSQRKKDQTISFLQEPARASVGSKKKRDSDVTAWELPTRYRCCDLLPVETVSIQKSVSDMKSDAADAAILCSPIRPTSSVTDNPIARSGAHSSQSLCSVPQGGNDSVSGR